MLLELSLNMQHVPDAAEIAMLALRKALNYLLDV
jgi:hypothetical protein